jgi:hypothetical protein
LEEAEKEKFDRYLYQCAIGKINETSLTKPTERNEDNQKTPEKSHLAKY